MRLSRATRGCSLAMLVAAATWASGDAAAPAGCLQQLAKDKCDPEDGPARCGTCAERHRADLLAANCTVGFITDYCEHKGPPPPPGPGPAPKPSCASWCAGHTGAWQEKCGWTACSLCPQCGAPPPPPRPINSSAVTVLVFGDSWGSLGPSWKEVQDTFDRHGVYSVVRSAAVGGTQACQWSSKGSEGPGSALADAAKQLFPELPDGPDHVWYTAGGNDFAEAGYQRCSNAATTLAEALACAETLFKVVRNCTQSLLEYYWRQYPASRVMQCGYDLPCQTGRCVGVDDHRFSFCKANQTCLDYTTVQWQEIYVGALKARYEEMGRNYTGLNILGTVQQAGGVAGASVGKPMMGQGSPCDLITECVHPIYGKAGATAVGEAFYDLYFSKYPKLPFK